VIAAAVLTGGQARRFQGRDKSRLPAWPGGPAILDHQLAALGSLAAEILIVTSRERATDFTPRDGAPPVRVVVDRYPATGPLGAIVTALDETGADTLVVVAGDMPGVSADALGNLLRRHAAARRDATVPESERGLEPLCAIYARSARPALAAALSAGRLSLQDALHSLELERVTGVSSALFRNVNAPEDL
jgi:molybdopterin-guanine dinucleotide biosynthesis protein A